VVSFVDEFTWRVQREDSCEAFQKKDLTKPRKLQTVTWALGSNTLPSIFSADLLKAYRKFL